MRPINKSQLTNESHPALFPEQPQRSASISTIYTRCVKQNWNMKEQAENRLQSIDDLMTLMKLDITVTDTRSPVDRKEAIAQ
jgi:hypothetical protein